MLIKGSTAVIMVLFSIGTVLPAWGRTNYFVTITGNDSAVGTNWATAFLTIGKAVSKAATGDAVLVSNGVYAITAQISITNGIALRSVNGAAVTTIRRSSGSCRILSLAHAEAVVDGFTISDGYPGGWNAKGGGIFIDPSGGSVSNCIITANQVANNGWGAGVYLGGGSVKHCQIVGNRNNSQYTFPGGGIYCAGAGRVEDCIIADNYRNGAYLNGGGLLRNCLIYGNSTWLAAGVIDWAVAGGVHLKNGGTVENCTVVDNYGSVVGGLACEGGGTVLNSIVHFNRSTANGSPNTSNTGSGWTYRNCSTLPAVTGTDNITAHPEFEDVSSHNYRLLPGSPSIDAGTNQLWMTADLDGSPRIASAIVDMGPYEYAVGALDCSPNGTPVTALGSNLVVFTAGVAGTNTTGLIYRWDFADNGTFDLEGADKAVVTNLYAPGLYSVRLIVTNAIGEIADRTRVNYIKMGPAIAYVATNATPAYPYQSWQTAAASVRDAIDAGVDGTTVLVSNGVYGITSHIALEKGITVQSVNGPAYTVITRTGSGDSRIFYISHANAIVDGFTISNGLIVNSWNSMGGGILIDGDGLVSNCHILRHKLDLNSWGCGVYLNKGGALKNCRIAGNWNTRYAYQGGGIYFYKGGTAENCIIVGNYLTGQSAAGAGAYLKNGGLLRNCLVYGNTNGTSSISPAAGGVHLDAGGTVESCTIVSNVSLTAGGTVSAAGGSILNSIVYFNRSNIAGNDNHATTSSGWTFDHCCTTPAVAGTDNIDADPRFVDADNGNYRLALDSPCFNNGLTLSWMETATDLDGRPRIQARRVDIGAYECVPPGGTVLWIR